MNSSAIWQIAFGIMIAIVALVIALGLRRVLAIGALLLWIPFQIIDTQYGSSSIIMAYGVTGILLIYGGLKLRMLPSLGFIVLAYFVSLALAEREGITRHLLYMFQLFPCFLVFQLAYNFATQVKNVRSVTTLLMAINALVIAYCALQLTVGPGESFVPFGIEEFTFNKNRHPGDPRLVGAFDAPGSTAGYFALMTLVCVVEMMFSSGRRKLVTLSLIGCNVLGLVATGNRAGFLIVLALTPVLLFVYRRELGAGRVLRLLVGGAAFLALAAAIAVNFTDFNQMFVRLDTVTETKDGIPLTRQAAWPVAIEKIKRDPWFGEGPSFWTAEDAEKIGQLQTEYDDEGAVDTAYDQYPHSLYLFLLRTVGVFGLVAVVGFFIRCWLVLLNANRHSEAPGYAGVIVRLGLFLIPAFLIAQFTLEFIRLTTMDYAQFIFALMGLLVGTADRSLSNPGQGHTLDGNAK